MFTLGEYYGHDGHLLRYGKLTPEDAHQPEAERKALVFIPGLGGSVKGSLAFLSELLGAYDVIYGLDLRSFGLNFQEEPLVSPQIIYDDLKGFLRSHIVQGHDQLDLAGISLGGIMASLLAVEEPERFRHLLLMAPAFQPSSLTFTPWYTYRNIYSPLLLEDRTWLQLPYDIRHVTRNPQVLADPQYTEGPPLNLRATFMIGVGKLGRRAFLKMKELKVPTMMMIPEGDLVCSPEAMAEAFSRIPPSTPKRCKAYPGMYHSVVMEPEVPQLTQDYLTWLQALDTLPLQPAHKAEGLPPRI